MKIEGLNSLITERERSGQAMGDLESLWIWQKADLAGKLPWYRKVSTNRMPAKFQIAQQIPVKSDYYARFQSNPDLALCRGAFNAPMLWNSNFFMTKPAMKILRLLMDVWLPDLKFGPGKCAVTIARTPWYWETVTANMKMIYDWGEDFTIRYLVMPNHVECCTRPILEWIAQTMPDVPVNIMDQYHPDNFCDPGSSKYNKKYEEISRRTTSQEVLQAFHYAQELGLHFESISYEKNTTGFRL